MFALGEHIVERYRIQTRIGAGGMGVVYKAEDLKTHRPVALKMLTHLKGIDHVQRFRREFVCSPDSITLMTESGSLREAVERFERRLIEQALRECGGVKKTAEQLGMTRQGLFKKMEKYGIKA